MWITVGLAITCGLIDCLVCACIRRRMKNLKKQEEKLKSKEFQMAVIESSSLNTTMTMPDSLNTTIQGD
jgi:hypothetical protein